MSGSGNKLHITPELFHFVCTDSVQIINDKDEAISMGNDLFGGKSLQSFSQLNSSDLLIN
ncbi:hypothetical protein B8W47_11895 [Cronobacter sakazakii]|nr:hypothetical protein ASV36_15775 [Enterobacter hormaechei subsp. steigerwaltii]KVJ95906.1 hypothetical protein AWS22_22320 [Enterobacter hormaechei subsp. steigerwaltii]KVJ97600.1 hypothetical protein AWS21_20945 [Enterobacter hormaechei subsp. steigerwaltii]PUY74089.1 hypothetical protein B8W47_11895 [Cronobacter sakazakii]